MVTQPATGQARMQMSTCGLIESEGSTAVSINASAFASPGLWNQLGRGPLLLSESPGSGTEQVPLTVN